MWALKWIVSAFVAGQAAMLWKKDASFKKDLEKKQWLDKVWYFFERLFHINQELFLDTRETLKNLDINAEMNKAKNTVETEALKLKLFMQQKEGEVETMGKDKAEKVVQEAEKRYTALVNYVQWYAEGMIKKYHLQEKVDEVKTTYQILKEKVEDIKKA